MVKAAVAFHVWDPETGQSVVFEPGDTVPASVVAVVGDHVLEGKGKKGKSDDDEGDDTELKGAALDDAVKAANDAGADIKTSGTADEKRAALADLDTP